MSYSCVILCSEKKDQVQQAKIDELKRRFVEFAVGSNVDIFEIEDPTNMSVEGGNGGGGDSSKAMKFVAGLDFRGVWNFRYCRHETKPDGSPDKEKNFPNPARIQMCIPYESITEARSALSTGGQGGLAFLADIFENVILVPFSVPKNPRGGLQVDGITGKIGLFV